LNEWANDYLSLPDGNKIDSNQNTIKIPSFNDDNSHHSLHECDLSYVYLHWYFDSLANEYVSDINKENQPESVKLGR
jgi:hypothetical protein